MKLLFRCLLDELQFLIRNAKMKGENLPWTELIHATSRWSKTVTREELNRVCPLLLDTLWREFCGDREIAINVVVMCAIYLDRTCDAFDVRYEPLPSAYLTLSKRIFAREYSSREVLRTDLLPRFLFSWPNSCVPYDEDEDNSYYIPSAEETAWMALNAGEWELLYVLVQYGFWNGSMDTDEHFPNIEFHRIWKCIQMRSRNPDIVVQLLSPKQSYLKCEAIWQNLREKDGMILEGHKRGFSRVSLIVRMLKMLALRPVYQEEYLRCLRTYFAAIPDPFVSSEEVREFLQHLLTSDSDRCVVEEIVDLYEEHFGRLVYGPRSLAHQCRLVVRKSLLENKSATLPKLVEDLKLPRSLSEFLLGKPEKKSW